MKRILSLAVIGTLLGGTAAGAVGSHQWPTLITPGPGAASIADLN
jgi:hypothetical protein